MLQCVAACCILVQCVADLGNVDKLSVTQMCCSVLHRVAACFRVLQCVAEFGDVDKHSATQIHHAKFLRDCVAVCCIVVQCVSAYCSVGECK